MPPRSTKAPKLTTLDTTPLRTSPGLRLARKSSRCSLLRLLEPGPAGQHDVVAVLVELDDLGLERLADVGLQVADPAQLDERRRQEAAQADVEDEAALDDLDDRALDDAVVFLDLLDVAPGPLVLGPLLGQDQAAFLVLLGEDEGLDLVAERHDLVGVDVVADRQLAGGDDALGLVADVEQDLVPVDLDDGAVDDLAVLDLDHGGVDGVVEGCRPGRPRRPGGGCTDAVVVEGADASGESGSWGRSGRSGAGRTTERICSSSGQVETARGGSRTSAAPLPSRRGTAQLARAYGVSGQVWPVATSRNSGVSSVRRAAA